MKTQKLALSIIGLLSVSNCFALAPQPITINNIPNLPPQPKQIPIFLNGLSGAINILNNDIISDINGIIFRINQISSLNNELEEIEKGPQVISNTSNLTILGKPTQLVYNSPVESNQEKEESIITIESEMNNDRLQIIALETQINLILQEEHFLIKNN